MTHTTAILAISLYIIASGMLVFRLIRTGDSSSKLFERVTRVIVMLGFSFHTATLLLMIQDPRIAALNNGADYFFFGSWTLALAYLFLSIKIAHAIFGAFLIPAVVLFMGSSSYLLHPSPDSMSSGVPTSSTLSILHSIPALVSVVSLALAFVVSCVFLIIDRRMKKKGVGSLALGGPNLQFLDRLNNRLVQLGFVAISLVVVSGGLWAVSERKPVFTPDTSVISGIIVWLALALLLHVRLVLRWSPKRVSRMTVIVTGVFFISVFAVMLFLGRVTHAALVM